MKDEILNTNGCGKCHYRNSFPNSSPCWKCIGINIDGDLYVTQSYFELRHNELIERKCGKWNVIDAAYESCSICGIKYSISSLFLVGFNNEPNFCPNCGSRMVTDGQDET